MAYHIKNKISKKAIRKIGKQIIPVELMQCVSKTSTESPKKK